MQMMDMFRFTCHGKITASHNLAGFIPEKVLFFDKSLELHEHEK